MRRRTTPPTLSSVRGMAARRAYLLNREVQAPYGFRIFSLSGEHVSAISSGARDHRYSWSLSEADAWLRRQPLLRDH
jgi:hypothetical protein